MAQPLEFEQLGYNSPDGMQIGRTSSDLLGFYGTTPVVRQTTSSNVSTVTTISNSSWGFNSQVELQNMISAVSTIHAALRALGIVT